MRDTYTAKVHREGTAWVGTVPDLEGVHSWHPKSLAGLRQGLAEAIVLAENLPDDEIGDVAACIVLDVEFPDRSVTEFTAAVRHKRESAARAQRAWTRRPAVEPAPPADTLRRPHPGSRRHSREPAQPGLPATDVGRSRRHRQDPPGIACRRTDGDDP